MTDTDTLIEFLDKKVDGILQSLGKDIDYLVSRFDTLEAATVESKKDFVTWGWFRLLVVAAVGGFIFLLMLDVGLHGAKDTAEAAPRAVLGAVK